MVLQSRGQVFLNRKRETSAGVTVTYSRKVGTVTTTGTLTAWAGQEQRDETLEPSRQARFDDRERDYLITFEELDGAGFHPPQEGDRITETLNGSPVVFEVVRRDRQPAWRWHDHTGQSRLIVHTRRV